MQDAFGAQQRNNHVSSRSAYENPAREDRQRLQPALSWATPRSVVIATADAEMRGRLVRVLTGMRWRVHEAVGGAEAMMQLDSARPEALLIDSWLPDLEVSEFCELIERTYPALEMLRLDGVALTADIRSPRRHELLLALRELPDRSHALSPRDLSGQSAVATADAEAFPEDRPLLSLPEIVGETDVMQELGAMIRLVAPTTATVLIEGETGTGKELVGRDRPVAGFRPFPRHLRCARPARSPVCRNLVTAA